jgi:two-component system, chemotaxis family, chemotaxis protein CheY
VAFNILVVDDSTVMRSMIIRVLQLSGLSLGQVFEAANGREGLQVLDKSRIDLALIDMNMPVMNGEEMIEALRKNKATADLPIIVVSTESNRNRVESIRRNNAEFVHKPFAPEILRKTVLQVTGVTDEHFSGESSLPKIGPDF